MKRRGRAAKQQPRSRINTSSGRRRRGGRRGRGHQIAAGTTVLAAALIAFAIATAGLGLATAPTAASDAPAPVPSGPATAPATEVQEGRDFNLVRGPTGGPARWPCQTPIPVVIEGDAPPGAEAALASAIEVLKEASGLPLVTGQNGEVAPASTGAIRIQYAPTDKRVYGVELGRNILGIARTSIEDPSTITGGWILIREDADPRTPVGMHTMIHEINHTLGLRHAQQESGQLMAPATPNDTTATLGPGDLHALAIVGCDQSG